MRRILRTGTCRASAGSRTCDGPRPPPGLRLDVGFEAGDEVSTFYDPMLGKIIAWGETRARSGRSAAARARRHRDRRRDHQSGAARQRACRRGISARRRGDGFSECAARAFAVRRTAGRRQRCGARRRLVCEPRHSTATRCGRTAAAGAWRRRRAATGASASAAWSSKLAAPDRYGAHLAGRTHDLRVAARGEGSLAVEFEGRTRQIQVLEHEGQLHLFRDGAQVTLRLWPHARMRCR